MKALSRGSRWVAGIASIALAAVAITVLAREPAATNAGATAAGSDRQAVALDAWSQGDTIDVLWAAPSRNAKADSGAAHDHSASSTHHETPSGKPIASASGAHHETPSGKPIDTAAYVLFHARSLDGGRSFGAATRIGADWAAVHAPHRGTDPQIAAAGDRLVAVWTSPGTSKWGTGPLAVAVSTDGGRTWSRGGNPADDNSTDGHGFIDVAADPAGGFHAVWLDGRDGDTGLRVAASADGVVWRPNANVDAVTCQCCWNDLAVLGPGRLAVLYRDRDPRDMAVAVTEDGARSWERRGTAGAFGWKVDGCPHVGGGLALFRQPENGGGSSGRASASAGDGARTRETIHAVVWTGTPDRAGLYDVASADDGRRWSEPRQLGGRGARHGDLAVAGDALVAAWDEGAAIYAARSADGTTWSEPRRLTDAAARASHPLVIATESGALVLWTESVGDDAPPRWAAARF